MLSSSYSSFDYIQRLLAYLMAEHLSCTPFIAITALSRTSSSKAFCLVYSLAVFCCWWQDSVICSQDLGRRTKLLFSETEEIYDKAPEVKHGSVSCIFWAHVRHWSALIPENILRNQTSKRFTKPHSAEGNDSTATTSCTGNAFHSLYPAQDLQPFVLCLAVLPSVFACGEALFSSGWRAATLDISLQHHFLEKFKTEFCWFNRIHSASSNKGSLEDVCPIPPVYMMYIPKKHSAEKKRLPYGSGQLGRQLSLLKVLQW